MGFSYEYFQKYLENLHNLMCRLVEESLLGTPSMETIRQLFSAMRVATWVCRRVSQRDIDLAIKSLDFTAKSLDKLFKKSNLKYKVESHTAQKVWFLRCC